MFKLVSRLKEVKGDLKVWHWQNYGYWNSSFCQIYDELLHDFGNHFLPCDARVGLKHNLGTVVQENFWKQKAHDDSIQLGDSNTKYFFPQSSSKVEDL